MKSLYLKVRASTNSATCPNTPILAQIYAKLAWMNQTMDLWSQFIDFFPIWSQGVVALAVFIGMVLLILSLVKRNLIWIILLIIFVPASIPIFKTMVDGIFYFLRNVLP